MKFIEKKQNKENWKNHIADWQNSGLSQSEYCRRNDISSRRFSKWKLKLENSETEFDSFVEVPLITGNAETELSINFKIKTDGEVIVSIKR